ncbi:MAG: hypothetical protein JKY65_03235 [Planctomycetes bacterium]|nr:hypothetical protein [Planctomycetota bacterium]
MKEQGRLLAGLSAAAQALDSTPELADLHVALAGAFLRRRERPEAADQLAAARACAAGHGADQRALTGALSARCLARHVLEGARADLCESSSHLEFEQAIQTLQGAVEAELTQSLSHLEQASDDPRLFARALRVWFEAAGESPKLPDLVRQRAWDLLRLRLSAASHLNLLRACSEPLRRLGLGREAVELAEELLRPGEVPLAQSEAAFQALIDLGAGVASPEASERFLQAAFVSPEGVDEESVPLLCHAFAAQGPGAAKPLIERLRRGRLAFGEGCVRVALVQALLAAGQPVEAELELAWEQASLLLHQNELQGAQVLTRLLPLAEGALRARFEADLWRLATRARDHSLLNEYLTCLAEHGRHTHPERILDDACARLRAGEGSWILWGALGKCAEVAGRAADSAQALRVAERIFQEAQLRHGVGEETPRTFSAVEALCAAAQTLLTLRLQGRAAALLEAALALIRGSHTLNQFALFESLGRVAEAAAPLRRPGVLAQTLSLAEERGSDPRRVITLMREIASRLTRAGPRISSGARLANLIAYLVRAGRAVSVEEVLAKVSGYDDNEADWSARRRRLERDRKLLADLKLGLDLRLLAASQD